MMSGSLKMTAACMNRFQDLRGQLLGESLPSGHSGAGNDFSSVINISFRDRRGFFWRIPLECFLRSSFHCPSKVGYNKVPHTR